MTKGIFEKPRKIFEANLVSNKNNVKKYVVEYTGEWEDWELITAVDNKLYDNPSKEILKINHYGGKVLNLPSEAPNIKNALVSIYID